VIPELDLVEEEDKITHEIRLNDSFEAHDEYNIFKFDAAYDKTEAEWGEIKKEILGEEEQRINNDKGLIREAEEGSDSDDEEEVKDQNVRFFLTYSTLAN
jgi:pre-mRNA-splicing factor CWC22